MICFIELRCFDSDALMSFRQKMLAFRSSRAYWVEWSLQTCEKPGLTIIGPQVSDWRNLADKANTASGQHVVLHGDHPFTLGLPILPRDFDMQELFSLFTGGAASVCTDDLFENDATGYMVLYKQTIPASAYM